MSQRYHGGYIMVGRSRRVPNVPNPILIIHDDPEAAFNLAHHLASQSVMQLLAETSESYTRMLDKYSLAERRDAILAWSKNLASSRIPPARAVFTLWEKDTKFLHRHREYILAALAQGNICSVLPEGNDPVPLGFQDCPAVRHPLTDDKVHQTISANAAFQVARRAHRRRRSPFDGSAGMENDYPPWYEWSERFSSAFRAFVVTLIAGAAISLSTLYGSMFGGNFSERTTLYIFLLVAAFFLLFVIARWIIAKTHGALRTLPAYIPAPQPPPIFVSYARADATKVDPLLQSVAKQGISLWVDRSDLKTPGAWAGQLTKAIRNGTGTVVMCTAAAFRSDNVAREIYLAAHFKKPIGPVFLEDVTPPDELLYFLIRPQHMRLFDVPPSDHVAQLTSYIKSLPHA